MSKSQLTAELGIRPLYTQRPDWLAGGTGTIRERQGRVEGESSFSLFCHVPSLVEPTQHNVGSLVHKTNSQR